MFDEETDSIIDAIPTSVRWIGRNSQQLISLASRGPVIAGYAPHKTANCCLRVVFVQINQMRYSMLASFRGADRWIITSDRARLCFPVSPVYILAQANWLLALVFLFTVQTWESFQSHHLRLISTSVKLHFINFVIRGCKQGFVRTSTFPLICFRCATRASAAHLDSEWSRSIRGVRRTHTWGLTLGRKPNKSIFQRCPAFALTQIPRRNYAVASPTEPNP